MRGRRGALVGGTAFIVPGLIAILALAVLFLASSPPRVVLAAGAGAGSAVAVVAAVGLLPASWRRVHLAGPAVQVRWWCYLVAGVFAAATIGPWVVLVLLACGAIELISRVTGGTNHAAAIAPVPLLAGGVIATGALTSLSWVAFKVGALSYGGGFVIIPLMQADAVDHYHWMTGSQFLNAVALGQITPGPYAILAAAAILLFAVKRGVVFTLLAAATAIILTTSGLALPR